MRKKFLLLIFISVVPLVFLCGFTKPVNANENSAIIILLSPYIEKAINEHYGDKVLIDYKGQMAERQAAFYSAEVNSIKQIDNKFVYEVNVTVPTYYGAHISIALEKMTFVISSLTEPKLTNYESIPN